MHPVQDGFAWGSGSVGLLFLFIILLVVVLTWRRCPTCSPAGLAETQLAQAGAAEDASSAVCSEPDEEAAAPGGCAAEQGVIPRGVRSDFCLKYMRYRCHDTLFA